MNGSGRGRRGRSAVVSESRRAAVGNSADGDTVSILLNSFDHHSESESGSSAISMCRFLRTLSGRIGTLGIKNSSSDDVGVEGMLFGLLDRSLSGISGTRRGFRYSNSSGMACSLRRGTWGWRLIMMSRSNDVLHSSTELYTLNGYCSNVTLYPE